MILFKEDGTPIKINNFDNNIIKNGNNGFCGVIFSENDITCTKLYYKDINQKK